MQWSIFDEIRGVWISHETISQVFDISSQSKQKLRSGEEKSSKSMLIKTGCTHLFHGCDTDIHTYFIAPPRWGFSGTILIIK